MAAPVHGLISAGRISLSRMTHGHVGSWRDRIAGGELIMGGSKPPTRSWARPVVVTMPAEIDVTNAARIGGGVGLAIAAGARVVAARLTGPTLFPSARIGR